MSRSRFSASSAARGLRNTFSLLLLGLAYAGCCWLLAWGVRGPREQWTAGTASIDTLLTLSAAVAAWCCLSWLTLGPVLAVLAHFPSRLSDLLGSAALTVTPRALRGVTASILGLTVGL